MLDNPDRDAEDIVEWASNPITSLSGFYTTYYLTEVKGVTELEPDFNRLVNDLENSFRKYAVFTVCTELMHVGDELDFVDPAHVENQHRKLKDVAETYNKDRLSEQMYNEFPTLDDYITEAVSLTNRSIMANDAWVVLDHDSHLHNDMVTGIVDVLYDMHDLVFTETEHERVKALLNAYKEHTSLYEDTESFLSKAKEMFNIEFWGRLYGGRDWSAICAFLLDDIDNDVLFVDQIGSIEHNTGMLFGKITEGDKDYDLLYKMFIERPTSPVMSIDNIRTRQREELAEVLHHKREGNIEEIMQRALDSGEFPWLGRYRRMV